MARFTQEQLAAIEAQGKTIVSASAGSGKTTVMIEKIIRLIKSGTDVNEILAVTYTKKAAAQMKEKLRKALVKAINEPSTTEQERERLKRQYNLVPSADISTVHSFCSKFIKTHFFAANVSNNFKIIAGEDADGVALKNRALDMIFEEAYESGEEDFQRLLSVYYRKKSDNKLRRILNRTYDALRTKEDYKAFLQNAGNFSEETFEDICQDLFENLRKKCDYYLELLAPEWNYFEKNAPKSRSFELANQIVDYLNSLIFSGSIFAAKSIPVPAYARKEYGQKYTAEYLGHVERLVFVKRKAQAVSEELDQFSTREEEKKAFLSSGETARAVGKYVIRLDEKYAELKREKGLLDYNDLEHISLALLKKEEIAAEMRGKYRYVFVDEYQDVNPVQEKILSYLTGENVFLVGDVKQSIYGFRGSKSEFFVQKQKAFEQDDCANSLYLTKNFRSADAVLEAVNSQFSLIMTNRNSEVDYAGTSNMQRGGLYETGSGRVRVHFTGKEETAKADERGVYSVREHTRRRSAALSLMAKKIKKIVETERLGQWFNADKGSFERVRYSDIAVLSRKKSGKIKEVIDAIAAAGIPVTSGSSVNICDFPEIKTLTDILRIIDNEAQDIPLGSALLSAMGGLKEKDLTDVRLAYPNEFYFRNACRRYACEKTDALSDKLNAFFAYLKKLRALSRVSDAGEVLSRVMSDTLMEAQLLGGEGGENALKRIHRFLEETHNPQPMSVHDFLERLRMLEYEIDYSENGGEDSVRVMTMHSSKGLEFPIVIVENLSDLFHGADREEILIDDKYGLAPKAYDMAALTSSQTVLRRLYERKQIAEGVRDELNLYYVALTRAKYGLHVIFTSETPIADICFAKSFEELTRFDAWEKYYVRDDSTELPFFVEERQAIALDQDRELVEQIKTALSWKYPHSGCEELRVKSSATGLMQTMDETELSERTFFPVDEGEETDTERGLAYHAFLENCDFSVANACLEGGVVNRIRLKAKVEEILANMRQNKTMEENYYSLLDAEKLTDILSAPVFLRLEGKTLYKEQRFLAAIPACEVLNMQGKAIADGECKEEIIFQGAIDLLAVDGDEVRIIDYKYSRRTAEGLRTHYAPQLALYKKAVSRILHVEESKIKCTIVNICRGFEVEL